MRRKRESDIDRLVDSFGLDNFTYQNISESEEQFKSLQRWPVFNEMSKGTLTSGPKNGIEKSNKHDAVNHRVISKFKV